MARNADIRIQLVSQFPFETLQGLLKQAMILRGAISGTLEKMAGSEEPHVFHVSIDSLKGKIATYVVESKSKFKLEGAPNSFTTAGLDSFIHELSYYCSLPSYNDKTFTSIITGEDRDVIWGFQDDMESLVMVNVEIYSALIRRFQNRGRVGSDNVHKFKRTVRDYIGIETVVEFTIDHINFGAHELQYRLLVDDGKIHSAIGKHNVFYIPNGGIPPSKTIQIEVPLIPVQMPVDQSNAYLRLASNITDATLDGMVDFSYPHTPAIANAAIKQMLNGITQFGGEFNSAEILIQKAPYTFRFSNVGASVGGIHYDFQILLETTVLFKSHHHKLEDLIKSAPHSEFTAYGLGFEVIVNLPANLTPRLRLPKPTEELTKKPGFLSRVKQAIFG